MKETPQNTPELLQLYTLHAELADRVSQRREGANRLYVSLIGSVFVLIIGFSGFYLERTLFDPWLIIFGGMVGMALSVSWFVVIRSYRHLNSGKFKVLHELEEKLAYQFFSREWEILKEGKDYKKYWKLTTVENFLPAMFFLLFLGFVIHILVTAF